MFFLSQEHTALFLAFERKPRPHTDGYMASTIAQYPSYVRCLQQLLEYSIWATDGKVSEAGHMTRFNLTVTVH